MPSWRHCHIVYWTHLFRNLKSVSPVSFSTPENSKFPQSLSLLIHSVSLSLSIAPANDWTSGVVHSRKHQKKTDRFTSRRQHYTVATLTINFCIVQYLLSILLDDSRSFLFHSTPVHLHTRKVALTFPLIECLWVLSIKIITMRTHFWSRRDKKYYYLIS